MLFRCVPSILYTENRTKMRPELVMPLFLVMTNAYILRDLTEDLNDAEILDLVNEIYRENTDLSRLQRNIRHMERVLFELRDKSRDDHSRESIENFRNYVKMLAAKKSTVNSPHHRRKSDRRKTIHRQKSPKPK